MVGHLWHMFFMTRILSRDYRIHYYIILWYGIVPYHTILYIPYRVKLHRVQQLSAHAREETVGLIFVNYPSNPTVHWLEASILSTG